MPRAKKFLPPKPGKEQLLIRPKSKPGTITEATKGMQRGEARTGFLGGGNIVRKPDYVPEPEVLDSEGVAHKRAILGLLAKVITPVTLSSKSTPEMDRRALVNKLKRLTMEDLRRFLPDAVESLTTSQMEQVVSGVTDIDEVDITEIQDRYRDISP